MDRRTVLSKRELEVLHLIADGLTDQEIAAKLVVSTGTIKTHVKHILDKLNARNRTQAAMSALRAGIVRLGL
jgi:DNA-binding NarL/FixJ family response regulator